MSRSVREGVCLGVQSRNLVTTRIKPMNLYHRVVTKAVTLGASQFLADLLAIQRTGDHINLGCSLHRASAIISAIDMQHGGWRERTSRTQPGTSGCHISMKPVRLAVILFV